MHFLELRTRKVIKNQENDKKISHSPPFIKLKVVC